MDQVRISLPQWSLQTKIRSIAKTNGDDGQAQPSTRISTHVPGRWDEGIVLSSVPFGVCDGLCARIVRRSSMSHQPPAPSGSIAFHEACAARESASAWIGSSERACLSEDHRARIVTGLPWVCVAVPAPTWRHERARVKS
jgi:hypothetical protein